MYNYVVQTPNRNALTSTLSEANALCKKYPKGACRILPLNKNPDEIQVPKDIPGKYKSSATSWVALQLRLENNDVLSKETQHALEMYFNMLGQKLGKFLSKANIFDIASPAELLNIVEAAKPSYQKHIDAKIERSTKIDLLDHFVTETKDWLVFSPKTKGASVLLGRNTEWCTAAPGLQHYENHTKKAPLWVFISKKDSTEKYQLWFPSNLYDTQAMDINDDPIDRNPFSLFRELLKIVQPFDKNAMEVRYHQYKSLDTWLYDYFITNNTERDTKYYIRDGKLGDKNGLGKTVGKDRYYYLDGKIGRAYDMPALETAEGDKYWYIDGKRGRAKDLPAIVKANGDKFWYLNGKEGRANGLQSVETYYGDKYWHIDGKRGRHNDLPAVEGADGSKAWYVDGKRGRAKDLPAEITAKGDMYWYVAGQSSRPNGLPAVETAEGDKYWYLDGKLGRANDLPAIVKANGDKY
jgi:hypothetical protein